MEQIVCDQCEKVIRKGTLKDDPFFALKYEKGKGFYPDVSWEVHFCSAKCVIQFLDKKFPERAKEELE